MCSESGKRTIAAHAPEHLLNIARIVFANEMSAQEVRVDDQKRRVLLQSAIKCKESAGSSPGIGVQSGSKPETTLESILLVMSGRSAAW